MPRAPLTDPDVRDSRIRFVRSRFRCIDRVDDARRGKWQVVQDLHEAVPGETNFAASPVKPETPASFHFVNEVRDTSAISSDAVIGVMPIHLGTEVLVLLTDWTVAVRPTPGRDPRDSTC